MSWKHVYSVALLVLFIAFGCDDNNSDKMDQIQCNMDKQCPLGEKCVNHECKSFWQDGDKEIDEIAEDGDLDADVFEEEWIDAEKEEEAVSPVPFRQDVIAAGDNHTCAITQEGGVQCWGSNQWGQLGRSGEGNYSRPVSVSGVAGNAKAVVCGSDHTCVLLQNGSVKCWGYNRYGQLGDKSNTESFLPVDVEGLDKNIVAIAAGNWHTCALESSGKMKCWGWNGSGQIGDGTTDESNIPVAVKGLQSGLTVKAIAAGKDFTCALMSNSKVECWGNNGSGQLGCLTFESSSNPGFVSNGNLSGVNTISAGFEHVCVALGIKTGLPRCWGANSFGQLGDGTEVKKNVPTAVKVLESGVALMAAGESFTCALLQSDGIKCWGANSEGQLGNNSTVRSMFPVDVTSLVDPGLIAITAGSNHACVLLENGKRKCWGKNAKGQLGNGQTSNSLIPVDVLDEVVSDGDEDEEANLDGDWELSENDLEEIAESEKEMEMEAEKEAEEQISDLEVEPRVLAAGDQHSCAITQTHRVKCWGSNDYGQLGDGTGASYSRWPVEPLDITDEVKSVATGNSHTCVLLAGGGVKCWGRNLYGQLGDETNEDKFIPVDVKNLQSGVAGIAAGGNHTCAVMENGVIKCWVRMTMVNLATVPSKKEAFRSMFWD